MAEGTPLRTSGNRRTPIPGTPDVPKLIGHEMVRVLGTMSSLTRRKRPIEGAALGTRHRPWWTLLSLVATAPILVEKGRRVRLPHRFWQRERMS
jgi:hypothetical protein